MAAYLRQQGVCEERITVIHNWADSHLIHPLAASDNPLRAEWDLRDRFVVGYSGNLGRVHEFQTMLGAIERLREHDDIVFLFIGAGYRRKGLRGEVERRGLDNVRFLPYQPRERLSESLSAPDVHLVSLQTCFEGFVVPSKFYGIAAAGRPVLFIGANDCELAQVIVRERCGAIIREGDAATLAEAILTLHRDPALSQQEGHNARQVLLRRFDRSLCINAWQELLDGLHNESVPLESKP